MCLLMRACGAELTHQRDFALRRIYSVGEPLTAEAIEWAERAFGVPVYDNYWQTETGSLVIANRPGVPVRRGSMDTPVTGVAAAMIDERGRELPAGIVGDIAVRRRFLRSLRATGISLKRRAPAFAPVGTSRGIADAATAKATSGSSCAMMM
ncbi:MAG: AMP-binding protein [Pyrinomonadaceae bacterium]